jgi:hypothetical protein
VKNRMATSSSLLLPNRHHISDDRVVEIVGRTIGAADYVEIMPVQMNGVLFMEVAGLNFMILEPRFGGDSLGRQPNHQELSAQRSCSHRDHRRCLWEEDPMLSEHR